MAWVLGFRGFRIEGVCFRVSVLKLGFKVSSLHLRVLYTPIKGSIFKLTCWAFGTDSSILAQKNAPGGQIGETEWTWSSASKALTSVKPRTLQIKSTCFDEMSRLLYKLQNYQTN